MNFARPVIPAVALATEPTAGATNVPHPPPGGGETVAPCAARLRAATPRSVFGAYIDPSTGELGWFGSEQERSHFNKYLVLRRASEQLTPKGVPT